MSDDIVIKNPEITSLYHYQTLELNTAVSSSIRDRAVYINDDIVLDEWKLSPLLNGEVYYSSPNDFNDPFELNFKMESSDNTIFSLEKIFYMSRELKGVPEQFKAIAQLIPKSAFNRATFPTSSSLNRLLIEQVKKQLGVYCFSESATDSIMWAHYAANYQGIVLEMERSVRNVCGLDTFRVEYPDELPKLNLDYILNDLMKLRDLPSGIEKMEMIEAGHIGKWIFTKAKSWGYEKEWRTLQSSSGLHPMPGKLKSIIFGSKVAPQIVTYLRDRTELLDVNFKFLKIDKANSSLYIDED
ncbi:DUF2971 domain-containing protein [Shewanella baltica]|uniref:DUF2971 domain-containing protein n=1 Tax=Shewanella baltica TaxID=62322 RepID=UPI003D7A5C66